MTTYGVRNPGTGLGQTQKCVHVLNWLTGSQSLLDNWISNSKTYTNERYKKNLHIFASTQKEKKRPHTIIKMNDHINMDSTITGSMIACS